MRSVMVSFTASPTGSMSQLTRHPGSARNSGLIATFQVQTKRRGGDHSTTLPLTFTLPSGMRITKSPPAFGTTSMVWPKK